MFGFYEGMLIALHCLHQEDAENPAARVCPGSRTHERGAVMTKNPHIGSSFEGWLDEAGIRSEVTTAAIKAVIACQLAEEMKKKRITKKRIAEAHEHEPGAARPPPGP